MKKVVISGEFITKTFVKGYKSIPSEVIGGIDSGDLLLGAEYNEVTDSLTLFFNNPNIKENSIEIKEVEVIMKASK